MLSDGSIVAIGDPEQRNRRLVQIFHFLPTLGVRKSGFLDLGGESRPQVFTYRDHTSLVTFARNRAGYIHELRMRNYDRITNVLSEPTTLLRFPPRHSAPPRIIPSEDGSLLLIITMGEEEEVTGSDGRGRTVIRPRQVARVELSNGETQVYADTVIYGDEVRDYKDQGIISNDGVATVVGLVELSDDYYRIDVARYRGASVDHFSRHLLNRLDSLVAGHRDDDRLSPDSLALARGSDGTVRIAFNFSDGRSKEALVLGRIDYRIKSVDMSVPILWKKSLVREITGSSESKLLSSHHVRELKVHGNGDMTVVIPSFWVGRSTVHMPGSYSDGYYTAGISTSAESAYLGSVFVAQVNDKDQVYFIDHIYRSESADDHDEARFSGGFSTFYTADSLYLILHNDDSTGVFLYSRSLRSKDDRFRSEQLATVYGSALPAIGMTQWESSSLLTLFFYRWRPTRRYTAMRIER